MTERSGEQRPTGAAIEVGTRVRGSDGVVGTVEQVVTDPTTGAVTSLMVRTEEGERVEVPASLLDQPASPGEVRVSASRGAMTSGMTALQEVGDRLVVPIREEVLVPTPRPIEIGQVRLHKRVEEVPSETIADLQHDEVTVERVPIGRPIDAVPAPRNEGETLIIPVIEEVLVTEKRLMLREEIRVTRRRVAERVPVQGTVRREVVEFEEVAAATADSPATTPGDADARGEPPLT